MVLFVLRSDLKNGDVLVVLMDVLKTFFQDTINTNLGSLIQDTLKILRKGSGQF